MLNDRQYLIIDLLAKSSTPITADEVAKIVVKSRRTIMRDLSTIKLHLEGEGIGQLLNNIEGQGYKIKITNSKVFEDFMQKSINDEEIILYELIQKEHVTIDDLTELLYVSKITAAEKMNIVKETYIGILNINVSHRGHSLKEPAYKKCILLSNLIEHNIKQYLSRVDIALEQYESLEMMIEHHLEIKEYFPNATTTQITNLFIAALELNNECGEQSDEDLEGLYQACNITYTKSAIALLLQVSDACIRMNLELTMKQIHTVLKMMEEQNSIHFDDDELAKQLYQHLKRMLCYPHYLKVKEIHNISNIKALYPFSFDLSLSFITLMEKLYGYQIPNQDLIGLYFAVGLEKLKKEKNVIVIYSNHNAVANINKQMLEASLTNCEVMIIDQEDRLVFERATLIINNMDDISLSNTNVMDAQYILSDQDIVLIREKLENISINHNVQAIFPREYSFTYEVEEKETWTSILEGICNHLEVDGVILHEEAKRIMEREQQGNNLIVGKYSIPHCISKKENFCVSIYVHLSKEVLIDDRSVQHVLLTVMSPKLQNNLNIFKFLHRYLNDHMDSLENIESYDEFIRYI